MDRIPNTNSTIWSQLFEYRIIRIIRCNSGLDSKSRTQLFYVCQINLQRVHQAYARAEQTCQHVEISRVNLFVLQIKLVRVLTTCLQH